MHPGWGFVVTCFLAFVATFLQPTARVLVDAGRACGSLYIYSADFAKRSFAKTAIFAAVSIPIAIGLYLAAQWWERRQENRSFAPYSFTGPRRATFIESLRTGTGRRSPLKIGYMASSADACVAAGTLLALISGGWLNY